MGCGWGKWAGGVVENCCFKTCVLQVRRFFGGDFVESKFIWNAKNTIVMVKMFLCLIKQFFPDN